MFSLTKRKANLTKQSFFYENLPGLTAKRVFLLRKSSRGASEGVEPLMKPSSAEGGYCAKHSRLRGWRNWQTHTSQKRMGNSMGVQVPPRALLLVLKVLRANYNFIHSRR